LSLNCCCHLLLYFAAFSFFWNKCLFICLYYIIFSCAVSS
jgi:hypothetical protein